jgi:hypothetical protein
MKQPKLRWSVDVMTAHCWTKLARFANEGDAWEYGAKQLHARVFLDNEFRGERRGRGWHGDRSQNEE